MARTQPHYDWPQAQGATERSSSAGSAEWEDLRSELVALLDQVENQVMSGKPPAGPAPRSAPARPTPGRHNEALKSVRQAVDRLAERGEPQGPAERREDVAGAIAQIRARQGVPTAAVAVPAPELGRFAEAIAAMGERIESFESRMAEQLASLDNRAEIAAEIAQLSEVVEMLAKAVGEGGTAQRLEAGLDRIAETVAEAGRAEREAMLARVEELAETVSKAGESEREATAARIVELGRVIDRLADHQVQQTGYSAETAARTEERLERSMQLIEESMRAIYDRIDALEGAQAAPAAEIDKISRDMAALVEAVRDRESRAPTTLLDKIDALNERITMIDAPSGAEREAMRESIEALRGIILDAIAPRFSSLEDRLDALGDRIVPAADPAPSIEAIQDQLRTIAARVEDTGARMAAPSDPSPSIEAIQAQLRAIAARVEDTGARLESLVQDEESLPPPPDLEALADLVAERTRSQMSSLAAEHAQADLSGLEDRLSRLLGDKDARESGEAIRFADVTDSISRVDERLKRLESTLTSRAARAVPAAAPERDDEMDDSRESEEEPADTALHAPELETGDVEVAQPAPRRPLRADTMPFDPASEEPPAPISRPAPPPAPEPGLARAALESLDAEIAPPPSTFPLDPETVERPAKPQSSFAPEAETGFTRDWLQPSSSAAEDAPTVNRASFIEAARRAARQQAEEDLDEPRSLIGRALSRFQRSETEFAGAPQPAPEPQAQAVAPEIGAIEDDAPEPGSFLARHKRTLLLSAALAVAVLLAGGLVLQRLAPPPSGAPAATATPGPAATPAPPAAAETAEDATPAPEPEAPAAPPAPAEAADAAPAPAAAAGPGALLSSVRIVDQNASLAAGAPNAALLLDAPGIDGIETAAIGPAADRIQATAEGMPLSFAASTPQLPAVDLPDDVGPDGLRAAAEAGDFRSQFEVAAILTEGHAVPQDLSAAAAWYERAAAQGFAPAQYRLGNLYESGRGVERDLEQARLWYQQAAEAGNRMSMHNLASLYAGGELETQDFAAAAHWFQEAAARGLTDSQFNLGMLHARGLGVPQSFEDSYIWFSLAAASGDEDAAAARDDVARSLDAETMQRLQAEIAQWRPAPIDIAANFAPIGTWSETFDPGETITNREVVTRVQTLLAKLGYEVGQPDGLVGPRTREAVRAFEQATGMSESGTINPRLLAVLGSQPV